MHENDPKIIAGQTTVAVKTNEAPTTNAVPYLA